MQEPSNFSELTECACTPLSLCYNLDKFNTFWVSLQFRSSYSDFVYKKDAIESQRFCVNFSDVFGTVISLSIRNRLLLTIFL